jgi:MazG family protein
MEAFDALIRVADRLMGPGGCPWDHKQTFDTLKPHLLEETHEVVEAVDLGETEKMVEELGDLFYLIIFYAKIAEKQDSFSLREVIEGVCEKLIRRHPHVFGDVQVIDAEDVKINWEKIKSTEKTASARKGPFEGIPPTLPSVNRAQKIIQRMKRIAPQFLEPTEPCGEEEIGAELFQLIVRAEGSGVDADSALRRALLHQERLFKS